MKTVSSKNIRFALALLVSTSLIPAGRQPLFALGTGFTYQGRLTDNGSFPTAAYDLRFTLYAVATGGSPVPGSSPIIASSVQVNNGLFTVTLNSSAEFGPNAFNGQNLWLNIEISKPPGPPYNWVPLAARQQLTPSPYAIHAGDAGTLGGQAPSTFAPSTGSSAYVAKSGDTMTGTLNLPGNGLAVGGSQLAIANGNVGINTLNPYSHLDVRGIFGLAGAGLSGSPYQRFDLRASTTDGLLFSAPEDAFGIRLPYHFNWTGGNAEAMTILGNGNVGIGTTTPHAALDIGWSFSNPSSIRFTESSVDYHSISAYYGGSPSINSLTFNIDNANGSTWPTMSLRGDGSALIRASSTNNGAVLGLVNTNGDCWLELDGGAPACIIDSGCNSVGGIRFKSNYCIDDAKIYYCGGFHFLDLQTERAFLSYAGLTVNGAICCTSDRNAKERFEPIDVREVLKRVANLPISSWSYKQDSATRHIGPVSQDFYAAFRIGPDDKHIATVDEEGVALAAIQGLNQELHAKDAEIRQLKESVAELKDIVLKLASEHAAKQ